MPNACMQSLAIDFSCATVHSLTKLQLAAPQGLYGLPPETALKKSQGIPAIPPSRCSGYAHQERVAARCSLSKDASPAIHLKLDMKRPYDDALHTFLCA